jgi:hypothetical protein
MDKFDIVGKQFDHLEVLGYSHEEPFQEKRQEKTCTRTRHYYRCRCKCGKETVIIRGNLITHHAKSCGCLKHRNTENSKTWGGYKEISLRTWSDIKNKAASRKDKNKREFSITIEDAWEKFEAQGGKCALSGLPLSLRATKGNYSEKTASLDRIDSSKGYVKSNIQWVHKTLNAMKRDYSDECFIEFCGLVTTYQNEKRNERR